MVIIADEELAILKSQIVTSSWAGTVFVLGGRDNKGMKSEIRNSKKGLFPRSREGFFLPQRRGDAERWPRRSAALQRLGDGALKRMGILLMTILLMGSVGWAEDEDSDTVVNAISSSSGVSYKVGRNMYLTDKGLFYEAGRGTYVGRDGVYTRIGKDWITPHGYMTENGGDYFGGGQSAIKIGKDYVRFRDDGESSYNFTAK